MERDTEEMLKNTDKITSGRSVQSVHNYQGCIWEADADMPFQSHFLKCMCPYVCIFKDLLGRLIYAYLSNCI